MQKNLLCQWNWKRKNNKLDEVDWEIGTDQFFFFTVNFSLIIVDFVVKIKKIFSWQSKTKIYDRQSVQLYHFLCNLLVSQKKEKKKRKKRYTCEVCWEIRSVEENLLNTSNVQLVQFYWTIILLSFFCLFTGPFQLINSRRAYHIASWTTYYNTININVIITVITN